MKHVVPLLDAVHWMITNVHPSEMNVPHDINIINFHKWLLDIPVIRLVYKKIFKIMVALLKSKRPCVG